MTRVVFLSLVLGGVAACNCGGRVPVTVCANGGCAVDSGVSCDSSRADNATRDTDCDGLSDAEEYGIDHGAGLRTDPCNPDTDADGVGDGIEMGRTQSVVAGCHFLGDLDPMGKTNPVRVDTDGDGLKDGEEDKNHDGKVDADETNPFRTDSDCDGLSDADEKKGTFFGCVTDPLKKDSDDDGVADGVEVGLASSIADTVCGYGARDFDADPSSRTDACKPDSDADGIVDGAEDTNHNGKIDSNELSPLDSGDAVGPASQACSTTNLKPILFKTTGGSDLKLGLVPSYSESTTLIDPATGERGVMVYDATHKAIGLAFVSVPVGANAGDEETEARSRLGGVSGAIVQSFTSWDGFVSVRATYDQSGADDLKTQANRIAKQFLGAGIEGLLVGSAGVGGPFKIQAEYVRRSDARAVLVFAITAANSNRRFELDDLAGGSALGQVADSSGTQCEVFTSIAPAAVDFLWVVDNSCSMASYQAAVGNAGSVLGAKLSQAGLNWRVGGLTTSYYTAGASTDYRPFTQQLSLMEQWFTQNSPSWFGIGGTGAEASLSSAQRYLQSALLPKTTDLAVNKVRVGADLHLILLCDADDQSPFAISSLNALFANYDGANAEAVVHGIVCPQGQLCGETQSIPRRNLSVISSSGGVLGDINVAQSGSAQLASTLEAIMHAAISRTGHRLLRPPIAPTVKVAIEPQGTIGVCNTADVPRDRLNGFDFDSASRRLVFFGSCRPSGAGKKVAVSYRFWNR